MPIFSTFSSSSTRRLPIGTLQALEPLLDHGAGYAVVPLKKAVQLVLGEGGEDAGRGEVVPTLQGAVDGGAEGHLAHVRLPLKDV